MAKGGSVFPMMFKTRQALPLPFGTFLRPRTGRVVRAKRARNSKGPSPQTRQFHEHGRVQYRPQPQTNRVHEQSASTFSSRQLARQRSVRILEHGKASTARKQALAWNGRYSRPRSDLELSMEANSVSKGTVHELRQAENDPRRSIAVSISPLTRFPVHIHTIPHYVHV